MIFEAEAPPGSAATNPQRARSLSAKYDRPVHFIIVNYDELPSPVNATKGHATKGQRTVVRPFTSLVPARFRWQAVGIRASHARSSVQGRSWLLGRNIHFAGLALGWIGLRRAGPQ